MVIFGKGWLGNRYALYCWSRSKKLVDFYSRGEQCDENTYSYDIEKNQKISLEKYKNILFTIPLRDNPDFKLGFKRILSSLTRNQHFYLISSTSVYSGLRGLCDEGTEIVEKDINSASGKTYKDYENILIESGTNFTIVRSGGHFGMGRVPLRRFKKNPHFYTNKYANYIHAYDLIRSLFFLMKSGEKPKIMNAVSPKQRSLREFHQNHLGKMVQFERIYGLSNCDYTHRAVSSWLIQRGFKFLM